MLTSYKIVLFSLIAAKVVLPLYIVSFFAAIVKIIINILEMNFKNPCNCCQQEQAFEIFLIKSIEFHLPSALLGHGSRPINSIDALRSVSPRHMILIDLLGGLADFLQPWGEEEYEEGGRIPPVVFPIEIDRGNYLVSPAATPPSISS